MVFKAMAGRDGGEKGAAVDGGVWEEEGGGQAGTVRYRLDQQTVSCKSSSTG